MREDELNTLFSFHQSKRSGATLKGAGMALAIAQDMIRQMGGHISASNEVGRGTTFHLRLPTT